MKLLMGFAHQLLADLREELSSSEQAPVAGRAATNCQVPNML